MSSGTVHRRSANKHPSFSCIVVPSARRILLDPAMPLGACYGNIVRCYGNIVRTPRWHQHRTRHQRTETTDEKCWAAGYQLHGVNWLVGCFVCLFDRWVCRVVWDKVPSHVPSAPLTKTVWLLEDCHTLRSGSLRLDGIDLSAPVRTSACQRHQNKPAHQCARQ